MLQWFCLSNSFKERSEGTEQLGATAGRIYLYWCGRSPRLSIADPKLIKAVTNNPRKYDQSIQHPAVYNLLGGSLLAMGGERWATQRRLLNPLFLVESLKVSLCVNSIAHSSYILQKMLNFFFSPFFLKKKIWGIFFSARIYQE